MEKKMNDIDALFRSLENREAEAPSAGWAQMESLLDAQPEGSKRRRVVAWWWAAAGLLPFLLLGFWWILAPETGRNRAQSIAVAEVPATKPIEKIESSQKLTPQSANHTDLIASQTLTGPSGKNKGAMVKTDGSSLSKISEPIQIIEKQDVVQNLPVALVGEETKLQPQIQAPASDQISDPATEKWVNPTAATVAVEASEIAQIEFRSGRKQPEEPEVASVEFKPGRLTLGQKLDRIRTRSLQNIASINEAKEDLLAFLSPRK